MKVSELIAKLEEILRTEGDLDVTCWENDGQVIEKHVDSVDIIDHEDGKFVHIDAANWTGST